MHWESPIRLVGSYFNAAASNYFQITPTQTLPAGTDLLLLTRSGANINITGIGGPPTQALWNRDVQAGMAGSVTDLWRSRLAVDWSGDPPMWVGSSGSATNQSALLLAAELGGLLAPVDVSGVTPSAAPPITVQLAAPTSGVPRLILTAMGQANTMSGTAMAQPPTPDWTILTPAIDSGLAVAAAFRIATEQGTFPARWGGGAGIGSPSAVMIAYRLPE